jgi:hypothetical protein
MIGVIDNDIIKKAACYSFLTSLCQTAGGQPVEFGVLSSARFVVADAIRKAGLSGDVNAALAALNQFLDSAEAVDPTRDEERLASELEYLAQTLALPLQGGESLLCAIVVSRDLSVLLTGDKRAIEALQTALGALPQFNGISGRVKCLEQLVIGLIEVHGLDAVRQKICSELIDKALMYSFSCLQSTAQLESVLEGLNSYINDLRSKAPQILGP